MEEALFLTRFASSITVIHRRDTLRASKIMQDRALANPKITFLWDSAVTQVTGDTKVTGLRVRNAKTGKEHVINIGGVFEAIGHEPRSDLFTGNLIPTRTATCWSTRHPPAPPWPASSPCGRRGRPHLPAGRDGRWYRPRRHRCRTLAGRPGTVSHRQPGADDYRWS